MFNLESSDTYLNQFDLEFFNSITLEIDEFNDSFSNATYLTTNDSNDLTTNDNKDLTTTSKKRIRQNKINSASKKCRQRQKIKSKLMESYIKQVNENINKLYTSLQDVNILEVMTRIYQMTADMNDYSENIIKEVNKI